MVLTKKDLKLLRKDVERLHAKEIPHDNASTWDAIRLAIVLLLIAVALRMFVFDIVRIKGSSMERTLSDKNRVFAEKLSYMVREPRRGEIVTAHYPPEIEKESVIKRIVALPGETVRVTDGIMFVNDIALDESMYWQGSIDDDIPPVTIPEKHVFLVGDNRNFSLDSRERLIGPVPYYRIIARVMFQVWPSNRIRYFEPGTTELHGEYVVE